KSGCLSSQQAALFVFGDSFFDPGNNHINTATDFQANFWPYAEYASLPIIPAYLEPNNDFTHGANFASGGAVDLQTQLRYFGDLVNHYRQNLGDAKSRQLLSDAVYLFSCGANDYQSPYYSYTQEQYANIVIGNTTKVIKGIYEKGGRNFGVVTAPLIGCWPRMRVRQPGNTCNTEIDELTRLHNQAHAKRLEHLEKQLEGFMALSSLMVHLYHVNKPSIAISYCFLFTICQVLYSCNFLSLCRAQEQYFLASLVLPVPRYPFKRQNVSFSSFVPHSSSPTKSSPYSFASVFFLPFFSRSNKVFSHQCVWCPRLSSSLCTLFAICRSLGNPQFFITFTCNVKWPEIKRYMAQYPELTRTDRADIMCKVFEQKVKDFVNFLKKVRTFGYVLQIEEYIYAEIPDHVEDPRGYKLVTDLMMHGPCGAANLGAPIPNYIVNTAELQVYILYELEAILNGFEKSVTDFGLQAPPNHLLKDLENKLLMEEKICNSDLPRQDALSLDKRKALFRNPGQNAQRPDESSRPFIWRKTVVLGGDFRQTPPVIKGAGKEEPIAASIAESHLWCHFKIYTLKENM
nr:GDSL esterase/lipase 1-like [Tanacetum cinerariifolium]